MNVSHLTGSASLFLRSSLRKKVTIINHLINDTDETASILTTVTGTD